MRLAVTLSLFAGLRVSVVHAVPYDWASVDPQYAIRRDVVIIGGGSSGTYAAAKLQRMGKKIVVVERQGVFGGHTSTYHVPNSNITIDYGVQGYGDVKVIRDHFASFDIPLVHVPLSETGFGIPNYADFRTGEILRNFTYSNDLSGYRTQSDKYPYLHYTTRLPNPVPKDLLLPFRDFLAKYDLQPETYNLFYNLEGLGDFLSQTTLYIVRYLSEEYLSGLDPGSPGALVTKRRYNQELYDKVQAQLGDDALVASHVLATHRDSSGVWLVVQTPKGIELIIAEKLLVSIPPLVSNMEPFGLDRTERSLFSKFSNSGWYVGLIRASGLPENFAYQNTRPDTPFNLPELPALYQMSPTIVPNIHLVRYGSIKKMSDKAVKKDMLRTFERVRASVLGDYTGALEPPEMLAYSSHYPFSLNVPPKDIECGFYNKLDDLQGYRNTWYTGAAIISHATGILWNFTDHLVDRMYEER
ncbi:Fc.00g091820.m01.CDS01 [Cosmosporella sp. VM-42]